MGTPKPKDILHKSYGRYIVAALLIGVCIFTVYSLVSQSDKKNKNDTTSSAEASGELTPATADETTQAENHKKQLANAKTPTAPTEEEPASVTPFISYAGQTSDKIEIVALVPGVSQDGGTCTALITQASSTVSKQVSANRNAKTTDCQIFTISRSEFSTNGNWSIVVSYQSSTAKGTSEPYVLNIQ